MISTRGAAGVGLVACFMIGACGGRTPTDLATIGSDAGAGVGSRAGGGAGASSGAGAGASSGASSGAGAGASSSGGESKGPVDAGPLHYYRTDAGPSIYQESLPQTPPGKSVTFTCLPLSLPVGPNGLPNCDVVVERPLGAETLAECQRCDDVPGLVPFVPSIPLSELGDDLTDQSCLCTVTPLANPAQCPLFDEEDDDGGDPAAWCYERPDPSSITAGVCSSVAQNGGILAYSPAVSLAGQLYVACFPLPTP
ncbi:MAG TPA: hypothetical protein VHV30_01670 [Polyangiaceae bacterium]|nr:hypothetical protein [Polyangiaceae bacterium]